LFNHCVSNFVLQLEDGKGIINYVNEYIYLGVKITKDGNRDPDINDRINKGRAAITKQNGILWDREVTPKTKTHIYHDSFYSPNYNVYISGLQVRASLYIQMYHPTRCSNFSGLLLFV
jgi:hypothetical protein